MKSRESLAHASGYHYTPITLVVVSIQLKASGLLAGVLQVSSQRLNRYSILNPKIKKLIANGPMITITVDAITRTPGNSMLTPASPAIASAR